MTTPSIAPRHPVVLVVLDGFGINPSKLNNAVHEANTPVLDAYFSSYPHTLLQASGAAVGLPDGQMGNSEVGHMTLGCGHTVRQNLVMLNDAIDNGAFFQNQALSAAMDKTAATDRPLHILGLISNGGVHSHNRHLLALLKMCRLHGVKPQLHMITDGRDTPPQSATGFLNDIEPALAEAKGSIATITGRYYAMDRDRRWERTEQAWRAIALNKGRFAATPHAAIAYAYANKETDEFIKPTVLPTSAPLQPGDQLISLNFRNDRARQIVAALGCRDFIGFDRGDSPLADITCMLPYDASFPMPHAFEPEKPVITLGKVISEAGLKQFHCAETEKYAHVTYFFNGGRNDPYSGETQMLIPSPKVATYDLKPEMSAAEVADATINAISSHNYPFILINFANGDMVGHSAVKDAVVRAVECLDTEVGRVLDAAMDAHYSVILTADHGNCEELIDPATGDPHTQHTAYPVPCLILDEQHWQLSNAGGLGNIAPTVLQLMGLDQPPAMTEKSLLLRPIRAATPYKQLEGAA